MGDELLAFGIFRSVLVAAEEDVAPHREGFGAELRAQAGGLFAGVDSHVREAFTEARLHEAAHGTWQRIPAAHAAGDLGTDAGSCHAGLLNLILWRARCVVDTGRC